MRDFLAVLFIVAETSTQWIQHIFVRLLGRDDREGASAIPRHIHEACIRLQHHYTETLLDSFFGEASDVCAICHARCEEHMSKRKSRSGGLNKLFITELKQWSASNGDQMKDWLDSLANHWLHSMETTVEDIDKQIDVVPDGVLMNLWGVDRSWMWSSARLTGGETGIETATRSGHPRDLDGHAWDTVNTWFSELDADGTGTLEGAEIHKLLQRMREPTDEQAIAKTMKSLDPDNNNAVTNEEFQNWCASPRPPSTRPARGHFATAAC
eukprot:COSAG01_NODE_274_length_19734_cov_122.033512_5_plen_268_part_00